jgi:peptide-methionine (S)-S-oxide reductase
MVMMLFTRKFRMPEPGEALPGREAEMAVPDRHDVLGTPLKPPFPEGLEQAVFGMGCFWGAERVATYEEVCSGATGHTEAVLVVYDPKQTSYEALLKLFWENHDPTQGMRQGNDVGTQYRSAIYTFSDAQAKAAQESRELFQERLRESGHGEISTEIAPTGPFYYAEPYHQQYLSKNPGGYCGLGGTGVSCPIGLAAT